MVLTLRRANILKSLKFIRYGRDKHGQKSEWDKNRRQQK